MVRTIQDINDQYNYKDEFPGGKADRSLVACGQCENYNELQYIYKTYLQPYVDKDLFTQQKAINALDKACAQVKSPRKRQDFYDFLSEELNISF